MKYLVIMALHIKLFISTPVNPTANDMAQHEVQTIKKLLTEKGSNPFLVVLNYNEFSREFFSDARIGCIHLVALEARYQELRYKKNE